MKIVCIGDTHGLHEDLVVPDGDVLIHAGDCTAYGGLDEVDRFGQWMAALPHEHKILIAGNHDRAFELEPSMAQQLVPQTIHYLQDRAVTIDDVVFWGAPWQPWFCDWSFNVKGAEIREHWDKIPPETDVLITHGPPFTVRDTTARGKMVGCHHLLQAVQRVNPELHIFGHIHEGYGEDHRAGMGWRTHFINASMVNERYRLANNPIEVEL